MKRAFLTFVTAVMLIASLTACTKSADTTTPNSRTRTGGTMWNDGRYYADDNGDVYDRDHTDMDRMGDNLRRAADDMMDGVGNAMRDMTGR